jgi:hypothetical protein
MKFSWKMRERLVAVFLIGGVLPLIIAMGYVGYHAKVKKDGQGWISYQWLNPATKKLDPKCSYVKATKVTIKGKKVWCGAGVYGINEAVCK